MRVLLLDNYDSFTYNIAYMLDQLGVDFDVKRNDKISLDDVVVYDRLILSPGPGIPSEGGMMIDIIERYASIKPFLGICLGHQGIAEVFGATLCNMTEVLHGVATKVTVCSPGEPLFKELDHSFLAGHYHSWIVEDKDFPSCLKITARDQGGLIMAISHRSYPVKGVQFHPESVLTSNGLSIIKNWIES